MLKNTRWRQPSTNWRERLERDPSHITLEGINCWHLGFELVASRTVIINILFFFLRHPVYHKEGWALKSWCFQIVLEKTLERPLDGKEIKPVSPKGNQLWIFIGRTVAEAEAPILWPPDVKNWLTEKDPDAGKDWRQEKTNSELSMSTSGGHFWVLGSLWVWVKKHWRRKKKKIIISLVLFQFLVSFPNLLVTT